MVGSEGGSACQTDAIAELFLNAPVPPALEYPALEPRKAPLMDSTWGIVFVLLVGVLIVVGSILVLRLHAFLALVLAAFTVAALTPGSALERYQIEQVSYSLVEMDRDSGTGVIDAGAAQGLRPGTPLLLISVDPESKRYRTVAELAVTEVVSSPETGKPQARGVLSEPTSVSWPPIDASRLRAVHPFQLQAATKAAQATIGARVSRGFGGTATQIGILIAMAAIVGKCLLDSGAADKIVRAALRLFGERGAPAAFLSSGFLLGVPVFFDTVFYLMIPLGKAMRIRTGRNYLLYVLTIVCGGTMAHSLVPPTPGPTIVAEQLGIDLGTMIFVGGTIGAICSLFGYFYATIANKYCELPLRESPDFSLEELEQAMAVEERELPSLALSLLPILLPIALIGGETIVSRGLLPVTPSEGIVRLVTTLGDKTTALMVSAAAALLILVGHKRPSLRELSTSIQAALASGGVIILITSAGGAFGQVLQQTGVADLIRDLPRASPAIVCTLAFLITTAIRTAQGSATVAMITAGGVLSGLAQSGNLGFHPVYLAVAIGCGSKPIAWMNDSGFWAITRMSGMTEAEGLKYITPLTGCMGLVGLVAIVIGVSLFPNW